MAACEGALKLCVSLVKQNNEGAKTSILLNKNHKFDIPSKKHLPVHLLQHSYLMVLRQWE